MADHLEAAAEAVTAQHEIELRRYLEWQQPANTWRPEVYAEAAVTAYLSSLLGELPEEAVKRLESAYLDSANALDAREEFREAARAFIRSLRDSLVSGRGETNDEDYGPSASRAARKGPGAGR